MKTVREMAEEAGLQSTEEGLYFVSQHDAGDPPYPGAPGFWGVTTVSRRIEISDLERFAALVRAEVLEEAAKVCEQVIADWVDESNRPTAAPLLFEAAANIRALVKEIPGAPPIPSPPPAA